MQTAKTTRMRRRYSNRYTHCLPGRVGTSCGQPVHVSFYLDETPEAFGKRDMHKVREILMMQSHG